MEIQQPEKGIALPDDIKKNTEIARERVILLELDVSRLGKVKLGLQKDIISFVSHLEYKKEEKSLLKEKIDAINVEIRDNNAVLKKLKIDIEVFSKRIKEDSEAIGKRQSEIDENEKRIDDELSKIRTRNSELDKREQSVINAEKLNKEKADRLRDILS